MNDIYVGINSGTSMDAIDCVAVTFNKDSDKKTIEIISDHSVDYPLKLKKSILSMAADHYNTNIKTLGELDQQLGIAYANSVNSLLSQANLKCSQIRAIGCHGQTIYHHPNGKYPFTLQIGNGNIIAAKTRIATINDFRGMDIAYHGQGAPLAPAFHKDLLSSLVEDRIILNLGGIANISVLSQSIPDTIGYDTGPANALMDAWISKNLNIAYDKDGNWAKSGKIIPELLTTMLQDPYFTLPYPKSTGTEYFNLNWILNILNKFSIKFLPVDIQTTLCELSAISITQSILNIPIKANAIYCCGGGANNTFYISRLNANIESISIKTTLELGLPVSLVEPSCFAWLAMQYLHKIPANIPSVTGAKNSAILGSLYNHI